MDVLTIIEKYLKENGYDGLFICGECACLIGELAPCGQMSIECTAGYKRETPGGEFDYVVERRRGENPPRRS